MARPKPAARPLSEAALTVLLQERFAAPEFAFMPQVRNGTGYSRRTTRTADALAMSLWPSRGLELYGFELKSDRADWMREKSDPSKMEEIGQFCDRWWLVVGREDLVQPGELPPTWGLIVPQGKKLVVKVEAPKLEAKPLDRIQLAAILRRAAECVVPRAQIQEATQRAREKAEESIEERIEIRTRRLKSAHKTLLQERKEFERISGLQWSSWDLGNVAEAVRFIRDGGLKGREERLRRLAESAREIAEDLARRVAALPDEELESERQAG